jgi:low affinity Fe/Cu permease
MRNPLQTVFKSAVVIVIFMILVMVLAEVTRFLKYSDDKYYIALTGVGTVVFAVGTLMFMYYQTRIADRVAKLQMFIQLDTRYDSEPLRSARNELATNLMLDPPNIVRSPAEDILDFFEMFASYTREKHLDFNMVSDGYSLPIRCYWHVLKEYIFEMREKYNDDSLFEHLLWLNRELENEYVKGKVGGLSHQLTKDQIQHFLQSETKTIIPFVLQTNE